MIAGEHFDEEFLIFLAEGSAEKDTHPHLADCTDCRSAVDEYRTVLTSFAEESTWDRHPMDETPNPQTIATLRAFVERTHREDAEAEPLVAELLSGPREEWMPRLIADAKYRTAGVVRKLIAATYAAIDRMPPDAVEIGRLACEVADNLDPAAYAVGTIEKLRGSAYKEVAFALLYTGEVEESLAAGRSSRAAMASLNDSDFEVARLDIIMTSIERATEDLASGIERSGRAAATLEQYGERARAGAALSAKASLYSMARDYSTARQLWSSVLAEYSDAITVDSRAELLMNIGYCERELGRTAEALRFLQAGAAIFKELGLASRLARAEYNIAVTLRASGDLQASAEKLVQVVTELTSIGMHGVAAMALMDLAEIHLIRANFAAVERLCRDAMRQFERTGLATSSRAMTALALLRDAAAQSRASKEMVVEVRQRFA
ncbi:MAG TPA: hypothetical protein VHU41_02525, partial [Thermoanaerobaculia bacterium]|nr:hypothetical protein [Thermoanaerobaculia bacterium]